MPPSGSFFPGAAAPENPGVGCFTSFFCMSFAFLISTKDPEYTGSFVCYVIRVLFCVGIHVPAVYYEALE